MSRAIHATTTLIPKKREKIGGTHVPSVSHSRPLGVASKTDKKRIAPILLQGDVQLSVNNPASSQNNIRNILGPTVISPTASNEVSVVPETNGATINAPESASDHSEKITLASQETPTAGTSTDAKPLRTEKRQGSDGLSMKRKRENERSSTQATTAVPKSREVAARAPKVLNERCVTLFASQVTHVLTTVCCLY